ncbi:MAG: universal stress protein [Candidatus Tectomicrobia bacterium]|nr:universal stress protein [Candidatus Tectomicrobia bacterium]
MYRNILLAVALQNWDEITPHAEAARLAAISLAKGSTGHLYVLTVYNYGKMVRLSMLEGDEVVGLYTESQYLESQKREIEEEVNEKMAKFILPIKGEGVDVTTLLRAGNPREEIVGIAREVKADIIVMGAHSKRTFLDVLLGGTAQTVSAKAPCPVLLVNPPEKLASSYR